MTVKQCASYTAIMTNQPPDYLSFFCRSPNAMVFFFTVQCCNVFFFTVVSLCRLKSSFFQSCTRSWAEGSVWRVVIWSTWSAKSHTLTHDPTFTVLTPAEPLLATSSHQVDYRLPICGRYAVFKKSFFFKKKAQPSGFFGFVGQAGKIR